MVLAVVNAEHPLSKVRVQDHGAFHQGDRIVLSTGSEIEKKLLVARKAEKPIEETVVTYGHTDAQDYDDEGYEKYLSADTLERLRQIQTDDYDDDDYDDDDYDYEDDDK
jgi:hypothetical protein